MKSSMLLLTAAVISSLWANSVEAAKPKALAKMDEQALEAEGLRDQRDAFFAARRISIDGDKNFNASKARFEAVQLMQAQMRRPSAVAAINWTSVGPAPTNGGQTPTSEPRIPSPVTGRLTSIDIDPVESAIYVGAAQGGVWRSRDNGANWSSLSDSMASQAIGSLAIDPSPHTAGNATIFVGTGEGNGTCDSYTGIGVYKSVDSGRSWTGPFGTALFTGRTINGIVVDRSNPNNVLLTLSSGISGISCIANPAGTAPLGVYRSTDGGATWAAVTPANPGSMVIQDPVTPTRFWAAMRASTAIVGSGGLLRSDDSGATWTQVFGTGGLPAVSSGLSRAWVTASAIAGAPSATIYVGTGETATPNAGKIYKSVDGGVNWVNMTAANGFCQGQCFYDMPITTEPGNPDVLYTGGAGASAGTTVPSQLMSSINGATSFSSRVRSTDNLAAIHADVHAIVVDPSNPARLWIATDGGVWRSDDRMQNLVNANGNLQTMQHQGCDLHPTDPNVIYSGTQDNGTMGRTTNSSAWKHLDFGDGGFALIDQTTPNNLVHTYFNQSNGLIAVGFTTNGFTTTMGQYSASQAPANGITLSDRVLFYAPIHLDRGLNNTLYFGTNKLYRATNFFVNAANPNHFAVLGGGVDLAPVAAGAGNALSAVETFRNPTPSTQADLIYTGSRSGSVFRSLDAGATFTAVDVTGPNLYVSDIVVDRTNASIVYQSRAGFGVGAQIRKSTDAGVTWATSALGLPNIPVNALVQDPNTASTLYAGTDVGVYISIDAGANWIPFNNGMPPVAVYDMKANATTGTLVACTHGRSSYALNLTQAADTYFRNGFEGF